MTPYSPGVGISWTDTLTLSDIGNVPSPTRRRNPDGDPGRMNGSGVPPPNGLINYAGVPWTNDHKLSDGDILALATLFRVGRRTVERWFAIPDARGRVEYRNCVPLRSSSLSGRAPGALGRRIITLPPITKVRCIMAACLVCEGGLTRDPIYTRGDKKNDNDPYLDLELAGDFLTLADAVTFVNSIVIGDEGELLYYGWVQITIEPNPERPAWNVYVYRFYPWPGESDPTGDAYDNERELESAPDAGF